MTKIIALIIITVYGIVLFLPFILSPVEFVLQAQIICVILALVFILSIVSMQKFIMRQNTVKITRVDILVFLLMLYQGYNVTRVPNRDTINIYMYLVTIIFYIHSRNTLTGKNITIFYLMIIFVTLGQILFGIMNQINNFNTIKHIHGTFFNSGLLAGFISLSIISLVNLLRGNFKKEKKLYLKQILCIIILIIQIYIMLRLTFRAALIASVCGVIVILHSLFSPKLLTLFFSMRNRFKILIFITLMFVLTGYCLYQLKPQSVDGRVLVWLSTIKMIKDKPVLGFGTGAFRQNYMNYQAQYLTTISNEQFKNLASDTSIAFNEPLKILTEQGIIGTIILVALLVSVFRAKNVKFRQEIISLKALLCTMIVFGLFSYPTESILFQIVFFFIITQLSSLADNQGVADFEVKKHMTITLTLLAIIGYIPIGISVFRYMESCRKFNKIISCNVIDNQIISQLQELYPQLSTTNEYLSYYGQTLNRLKEYAQAIPILEQQGRCFPSSRQRIELGISLHGRGNYDEANEKWIEASKMVPALIKPHYLLAKSYFLQRKKELGCQQAKIVLTKKPKINTPEIYYMKQEIKKISAAQEAELFNVRFNYNKNEKSKEKKVFLDTNIHDTCSTASVSRVSGRFGN